MQRRTSEWLVLGLGGSLYLGLYLARVLTARVPSFGFLIWNLSLAAVPWALAVAIERLHRRGAGAGVLAPLGILWLLFLPNGPYILTDFVHLRVRDPVPLYYDVLMIGSAAITGLLASAFSVRRVHSVLAARFSSRVAWSVASVAMLASGFGIYLGRFERWNSWDLVVHPLALLESLGEIPPIRAVVVTVGAAGLLLIAVLAVHPGTALEEVAGRGGEA